MTRHDQDMVKIAISFYVVSFIEIFYGVNRIENDLKEAAATVEELQNARDILDNESKIYEDLEFQHLEEESEL